MRGRSGIYQTIFGRAARLTKKRTGRFPLASDCSASPQNQALDGSQTALPTISDIASAAGVSVDTVLRVLNRDDVSEDVSRRVTAVIEAHGFRGPQSPRSERSDDQPAETAPQPPAVSGALAPRAVTGEIDRRPQPNEEGLVDGPREQLLRAVARLTAEAEAGGSPVPSSLRYESLEVGPLAERMTVMDRLVERLLENLEGLNAELRRGRTERLEDLTLLVDLITTSSRTVDRRLNRIERKLNGAPEQTGNDGVISIDERRRLDREERF
jgi:hypothetical protein